MNTIGKILAGVGLGIVTAAAISAINKCIQNSRAKKDKNDMPEVTVTASIAVNSPIICPNIEGIKTSGYFMLHEMDIEKYNPDIILPPIKKYVKFTILSSRHDKDALIFHPDSGEFSQSTIIDWYNGKTISAICNAHAADYIPYSCIENLKVGDQFNIKLPGIYMEGLLNSLSHNDYKSNPEIFKPCIINLNLTLGMEPNLSE